jgi:hypothetical protein
MLMAARAPPLSPTASWSHSMSLAGPAVPDPAAVQAAKAVLKSTPGISRSPGGTPAKERARHDLASAGGFLRFALEQRFRAVRPPAQHAAQLNSDSPSSFGNSGF